MTLRKQRAASSKLSAEEERIVSALQEAARTKRLPPGLDLAKLIQETHSPSIRSAAALALLDLVHPDAADILIGLIRRKHTLGHNGTLLFVLDELGASVPLHTLIEIIEKDVYEARAEALFLLEHAKATAAERAQAIEKLTAMQRSADEELAEAASEAIAILEDA